MTDRPNVERPRQTRHRSQPTIPPPRRRRGYERESIGEAMAKSFIRSVAEALSGRPLRG